MRIQRCLAVFCCIIIAFVFNIKTVSVASEGYIEESLTVGVPVDRCPMFYIDPSTDEIVGIGVDLMRLAGQESGYNFIFKPISEKNLKDALDNEEYDIIMPFGSAIKSTAGNPSIVSDNLIQTPFTLVTQNDRDFPTFNKIRVGMLISLKGVAETVGQLFPGIEIVFFENMQESVNALRVGKVDALLNNSYVWSYILQKPSYSKLKVQPLSMFSMDFRAGAQDNPKGQAVIERLNNGISKISDTQRQAIILDYTTRRLYKKNLFDYLYQYGLIVAVFIILLLIKIKENHQLKKAEAIAEEASNAKSMFLANMSHEIRTPINTIMGMGEMISRETTDSRILQYTYSINRSANSLLCLVNDILDFSRMEAGKLKLRNDPYHLSSLVTDVNVMIKGRAESKELTYKVNINNDIPDELIGDETRLKQVIINLLTNGVKYTASGYVELGIDYEKAGPDTIELKISVEDTGIGMKKTEIDKLFDAFERLDEVKNSTIEGTGLGMSIVKHILDAMESTLDIQSVYGKGSKFSFVIKQKVACWEKIGDYNETAEKVVSKYGSYRPRFVAPDAKVLIVDDTDINIKVITGLLEPTKMKVDTALSGKMALKLLEKTKYDILLIDYRMPEMDGLELLKHIKSDLDSINYYSVCIVLTANAIEGARELYIKAGFDEYLEKPVNGRHLEEMFLRFLPQDKILETEKTDADTEEEIKESIDENETDGLSDDLKELQEQGLINVDEGIEYAGSEDLFRETLEFFRDSVDKKADEIEELYTAENIEDYTIKVHALKGTAKIIGANELSDKARLLEEAGKRNDLDYIRDNNSELMELYHRYKDVLANI